MSQKWCIFLPKKAPPSLEAPNAACFSSGFEIPFQACHCNKIRRKKFLQGCASPALFHLQRRNEQSTSPTISSFRHTSQPRHPPECKRFNGCSPAKTTTRPKPDFFSLKRWSLQNNQHIYNLLLDRSSARDRGLARCLTDRHANT